MNGLRERTTRLFVVRHGQTADNVAMRYLGRRDERLTDTGRTQADRAAAALASFPIQVIFTSPLIRAADTAARIQEKCGAVLFEDVRLIEGSFGRWEGFRRDELIRSGGPDAERLLQWEADASCAPPGGESLQDVQARVVDFVSELEREWAGSAVALVSHVGPIKALLAYALDIPLLATRRLFLDPCSISVVDLGERPFVRLFNSHAHLGWESPRWAVLPGDAEL
jgi:broad specificity phosphatase PhoE